VRTDNCRDSNRRSSLGGARHPGKEKGAAVFRCPFAFNEFRRAGYRILVTAF
jgi:hypothetical protein